MSTTVCQDCQKISLDDEKLSRITFTRKNGEPFLYSGRDVEGYFSVRIPSYRQDEFPGLPGLQRSAANGCSLCGLLRSTVLSKSTPHDLNYLERGPDNRVNPNNIRITLTLESFRYHWLPHGKERRKSSVGYLAVLSVIAVLRSFWWKLSRDIYFEVCAPPGPLAIWLKVSRIIADDNAWSPSRIREIKSWISDCEQNCHHAGITTALPTRLIDVGSEDGRDQMRLILSSDIPRNRRGGEHCKYITLSYCWGDPTDSSFFTAQKSTLKQLLQNIPMDRLPRTCRDAVVVTRGLGIRYLWIDALCIVQDDPGDWAKQSAIMGQIYTNSWLTLIALRGKSCHDGFLDREIGTKAPLYYKSSVEPDIHGTYWVRQESSYTPMRCEHGELGAITADIAESEWDSRGWTLQEDQLSTRKLIFGTEDIYYFCGNRIWTENAEKCLSAKGWSIPFLDSLSDDMAPKELFSVWYATVESYAHRDFTYVMDRLPAISGLSQTIFKRMVGSYLAGLWQSDLFDGLLWIRLAWDRSVMSGAAFIDSVVHPTYYTAPSWSWARSQQEVGFLCNIPPHPKNISEIEVLEAKTALAGPNPFGGIQDGHLLLRGMALELKGPRIFGVDGMEVDHWEWLQGNVWLEAISHEGFQIARCALDWEFPFKTPEGFELRQAPWDQMMMLIIASHSTDAGDRRNVENEEYGEEVEEEEEDEKAVKDEINEANESIVSDDNIDFEDEERKSKQGEEYNPCGEDSSPEERRNYFGLLLLPATREVYSWVRVGVCILRSDKQGRAVLKSCSERIVKVV